MRITVDDIHFAAAALAGQVIRTPSIESRVLSKVSRRIGTCGGNIIEVYTNACSVMSRSGRRMLTS